MKVSEMLRSACVLIIRNDGYVLGVTRKDDLNDWGLPGGKLEAGEAPDVGAARELLEETGLIVDPTDLRWVFIRDNNGYLSVTFLAPYHRGTIGTTEAGRVDWVTWDDLFAGSFGEYNRALHEKLFAGVLKARL